MIAVGFRQRTEGKYEVLYIDVLEYNVENNEETTVKKSVQALWLECSLKEWNDEIDPYLQTVKHPKKIDYSKIVAYFPTYLEVNSVKKDFLGFRTERGLGKVVKKATRGWGDYD